jgi:hypothetical protein
MEFPISTVQTTTEKSFDQQAIGTQLLRIRHSQMLDSDLRQRRQSAQCFLDAMNEELLEYAIYSSEEPITSPSWEQHSCAFPWYNKSAGERMKPTICLIFLLF